MKVLIIIIIGLIAWYMLGGTNEDTYSGDTRTQTVYDVDNCIDEVHDRTGIDINDRARLAEIGGC